MNAQDYEWLASTCEHASVEAGDSAQAAEMRTIARSLRRRATRARCQHEASTLSVVANALADLFKRNHASDRRA